MLVLAFDSHGDEIRWALRHGGPISGRLLPTGCMTDTVRIDDALRIVALACIVANLKGLD